MFMENVSKKHFLQNGLFRRKNGFENLENHQKIKISNLCLYSNCVSLTTVPDKYIMNSTYICLCMNQFTHF